MQKVVFDFDGTIINTNSFPRFVIHTFRRSILELNLNILLQLLIHTIKRKILKQMDHLTYKKKITELAIPQHWTEDFSKLIKKHVSQAAMEQYRRHYDLGHAIYISSAAPEFYLAECCKEIFNDHQPEKVIGSKAYKNGFMENFSSQKVRSLYCHSILKGEEKLDFCYTDSADDIPLCLAAINSVFINPKAKDLRLIKESKLISYKIIYDHL